MLLMDSVDNVEKELKHCLSDNAVFIYWSHHDERFDYLKIQDNQIFHFELRLLHRQLHSRVIKNISSEELSIIDEKTLQPIEVTFATTKCVPYALLCKKGDLQHADITSYLFTSPSCRDKTRQYINKREKEDCV